MRREFAIISVLLAAVLAFAPFAADAAQPANAPPGKVKVLITFKQPPGRAEQELVRGANGLVKYTYHLIPVIAATLPETAIAALGKNPRVDRIEIDAEVRAIDAELDASWGVKHIGAGIVHDSGNKGAGISVAVLDTGIDYSHSDLDANYADGRDFVNSDDDPMDDHGHGTHVAGSIAAEDNESGVVGGAPEARLHALKVLNASGGGYTSDVIAAIQWSVDHAVQVVNMSFSGDGTVAEESACQVAYNAGVLLVAAAGNEGTPPGKGDSVGAPARYPSVIAVAAVDSKNARPRWSSTGPAVELAAPGVSIVSTYVGGGYATMNGTSMASPHVAGVAALVLWAYPASSNSAIRARLQNTADDLGAAGRDSLYGYGLVDADEAAAPPAATGTITGTVTDAPTGEPIPDATVSADSGQTAQTGESGTYTLTGVPTGTRTVGASAAGYESETKQASVPENGTAVVDFALSPQAASGMVSVESVTYSTSGGRKDKDLSVKIVIVEDLGLVVSGASVSIRLSHESGTNWSRTATTDSSGSVSFTVKNAPAGCYTTTVTSVVASDLTWDGLTPKNSFCK